VEAVKADALLDKLSDYYFVDCSSGGQKARESFELNHIKGAIFLDIDQFRDTESAYPHMCPSKS
jgi:3-mercaptopyruvate sulfurtransferase SseA